MSSFVADIQRVHPPGGWCNGQRRLPQNHAQRNYQLHQTVRLGQDRWHLHRDITLHWVGFTGLTPAGAELSLLTFFSKLGRQLSCTNCLLLQIVWPTYLRHIHSLQVPWCACYVPTYLSVDFLRIYSWNESGPDFSFAKINLSQQTLKTTTPFRHIHFGVSYKTFQEACLTVERCVFLPQRTAIDLMQQLDWTTFKNNVAVNANSSHHESSKEDVLW